MGHHVTTIVSIRIGRYEIRSENSPTEPLYLTPEPVVAVTRRSNGLRWHTKGQPVTEFSHWPLVLSSFPYFLTCHFSNDKPYVFSGHPRPGFVRRRGDELR